MSNTIKAKILNALLDKYERSSFFRDEKKPTRRIMLAFYDGGKSDFPYYDIEQSERRILINNAVVELSACKLLFFDWMKGEHEHIIAKVWLNIDNLSSAYQIAGRKSKGDIIDKICLEIANVKNQAESKWAYDFLQDMYDTMKYKRNLVNAIPSDNKERKLLLDTIFAIDKLSGTECMERVFSLQTFNDSKKFERYVKPKLLNILRKYLETDDDLADDDILKQIGIVKYPEQFEFCGNISITLDDDNINYSCLLSGGIIYSSDLISESITIDPSIDKIITIENRANYIEYIRKTKIKSELVVYHGGQYSPRKRKFFQALVNALPKKCKWYHWSDIDYGGFIMLSRLRREIYQTVIPYRMDIDELERYGRFTAEIKPQYVKKLIQLRTRPDLSDCYDCIDYMIKNRIRLEQEAMLIDL